MNHCDVLVTKVLPEGMHNHDAFGQSASFHLVADRLIPTRLGTNIWAFVDWHDGAEASLQMQNLIRSHPMTARAKVIMVLDQPDLASGQKAMSLGADGYLVGPLDRGKIIDRLLVEQQGGRHEAQRHRIALGDLLVDVSAFAVRWKGQPIPLSRTELLLLRHLVERCCQVTTRQELIAALGKPADSIALRTIDIWIGRIRRALAKAGVTYDLRSVRSVGYVLDER
ncbi:transcriptional regulator [Novosphingobium kunmingense]|uniref:Transcriptional regulator n=2 Tax=Novosphingobium kunmingense TaxID=1211806 RepID=A0A2N0HJD6_9SPHN|nr:transcriptional regulator [Novosphingobium kunmingense]